MSVLTLTMMYETAWQFIATDNGICSQFLEMDSEAVKVNFSLIIPMPRKAFFYALFTYLRLLLCGMVE